MSVKMGGFVVGIAPRAMQKNQSFNPTQNLYTKHLRSFFCKIKIEKSTKQVCWKPGSGSVELVSGSAYSLVYIMCESSGRRK